MTPAPGSGSAWVVGVFAAMAVAAGAMLPVQNAINSRLRSLLGGDPVQASFVSFTAGAMLMALYVVGTRLPWPDAAGLSAIPWWAWVGGGATGILYMATTIWLMPRLGAAAVFTLVVAGNLLTALTLEQVGFLDVPARELSPVRLLGVLLLVAGVALIQFGK
jgi:transporter family-2 protein